MNAKSQCIWLNFEGQIISVYVLKKIDFIFFTPREIIRSMRESLRNDLYIDDQKTRFQSLVQNPKNLGEATRVVGPL